MALCRDKLISTALVPVRLIAIAAAFASVGASAADSTTSVRRSIAELTPAATLHLGKTADWVAIADHAVWVGTTGPNAVVEIDPRTNTRAATVRVPGKPCAGLAIGFGSLWVPLCAAPNALVRVDLRTGALRALPGIGPAEREGGITTSPDSVWLIIDKRASLARIDPDTGKIRQTIRVPPGSYNPRYSDGQIWVTRAAGAEVTVVDANTGAVTASVSTPARPRFLTSGDGAVWTLNQGDGSLTRIDTRTRHVVANIALHTPGDGGDITFGYGMVWTSMAKVPLSLIDATNAVLLCQWFGPGGDALGVGEDAIWLTDYDAGTIMRIPLNEAFRHCKGSAALTTYDESKSQHR